MILYVCLAFERVGWFLCFKKGFIWSLVFQSKKKKKGGGWNLFIASLCVWELPQELHKWGSQCASVLLCNTDIMLTVPGVPVADGHRLNVTSFCIGKIQFGKYKLKEKNEMQNWMMLIEIAQRDDKNLIVWKKQIFVFVFFSILPTWTGSEFCIGISYRGFSADLLALRNTLEGLG